MQFAVQRTLFASTVEINIFGSIGYQGVVGEKKFQKYRAAKTLKLVRCKPNGDQLIKHQRYEIKAKAGSTFQTAESKRTLEIFLILVSINAMVWAILLVIGAVLMIISTILSCCQCDTSN